MWGLALCLPRPGRPQGSPLQCDEDFRQTVLGNILTDLGQFLLAETHFQQNIAWYEQVEDLYLSNAKSNLGWLYKRMGRLAEAVATYQKAIALAQRYPEHAWVQAWGQSYREELAALQTCQVFQTCQVQRGKRLTAVSRSCRVRWCITTSSKLMKAFPLFILRYMVKSFR